MVISQYNYIVLNRFHRLGKFHHLGFRVSIFPCKNYVCIFWFHHVIVGGNISI